MKEATTTTTTTTPAARPHAQKMTSEPSPREAPDRARVPVAQRISGQAPARTLGGPRGTRHAELAATVRELSLQYEKDPAQVEEKRLALLQLEAMVTYGGDVSRLANEVNDLKEQLASLRDTVEKVANGNSGKARGGNRAAAFLARVRGGKQPRAHLRFRATTRG